MNCVRYLILITVVIFYSKTAYAEFYRYIDKDGKTIYTDDLTKVPVEQQSRIREYNGYKGDVPPKPETTIPQEKSQPQSETKKNDQSNQTTLNETKKRIDAMKQELDEEYQAISKEKERIEELRSKQTSAQETKSYNESLLKLNERADEYEKKRKIYNTEAEAYNAAIKKPVEAKQPEASKSP